MNDEKYITKGMKKGSQYSVYHTHPEDCHYVQKAYDYRSVSEREVKWHDMSLCSVCEALENEE